MDDQLLQSLLYRSEDPSVDYKAEQYVFTKNDVQEEGLSKAERAQLLDKKKSELLKDVLAMANSWRDGPAYILLGFKEQKPLPPTLVGLDDDKLHDDAHFQQFIGSKINQPLEFKYAVRAYQGKTVGIITIPKQRRPFYATEQYGYVEKNVVYVRRGSSTAIADPMEISLMGADALQRAAQPEVELEFFNKEGGPLSSAPHTITVPEFETEELPDLEPAPRGPFDMGLTMAGRYTDRDFWRKLRSYVETRSRAIPMRVVVTNKSPFALSDCELHISAKQNGREVLLQLGDNQPEAPEPSRFLGTIGNIRSPLVQNPVQVKKEDGQQFALATFQNILPGASAKGAEFLSALPLTGGVVTLCCRLFARELSVPVNFEKEFEVIATAEPWDFKKLKHLSVRLAEE